MTTNPQAPPPRWMRFVRRFAVPIIVGWSLVTVGLNVLVPPIESVARQHAVTMSPQDAPAMIAAKRIGAVFGETDSDSTAVIVIEGDTPLAGPAHRFHDQLITALRADRDHVHHVTDVWGDPLTADGVQSRDGKAAYVRLDLAGDQGSTRGNASVEAVRHIVDTTPAPPGVTAYLTGPAPLTTDMNQAADKSMLVMMGVTGVVIMIMLYLAYRAVSTVLLILVMVGFEMGTARGLIAFLGDHDLLDFSTFVVAMLSSLAIAAGTDYAIFLVGRYQEARHAGQNPETAYYSMFGGTVHIIAGSGLTIAGATFCLHLARLSYFKALGIPSALGLLVVVAGALTAAPAVVAVASRFGLLEPKRPVRARTWRRIGTATVRWPAPVLAASITLAVIGILIVPTMKISYDDRFYVPTDLPSNIGYAAAERHFSAATMNPDVLMVEADHDLRTPADMILLDRIAKEVFDSPGVAMVQSITRPLGGPTPHTSIPFQVSAQAIPVRENLRFMKDRATDLVTMSDDLGVAITAMQRTYQLAQRIADTTHHMVGDIAELKATLDALRDHLADFDDFARPVRNYFYAEQHCYDIPACFGIKSVFDALDGVDTFTDNLTSLVTDATGIDALLPRMLQQFPPIIAVAQSMQASLRTLHSTFAGLLDQISQMTDTASAMGEAFDASQSGDYFYLPPEAFSNPNFQRGLALFLSPDGHAARFIITHDTDPATPAGISAVVPELTAAHHAVKGTALTDAHFSLAGTAAIYRDIQSGARYDLLIVGLAALTLIFVVMLVITRAPIAALAIVGTVLLSLGAAFGLSVLVWQHLIGLDLNWIAPVFGLIILLAVGSDYNLLLVSRFQEELHAGLKTGIIRSMASTGGVVTAAGLVFAFTMMSMAASDLRSIGQAGTTIGLGLLFDTLIVRSLMTPSIAALLGAWFWWPQPTTPRPTRTPTRPPQPRDTATTNP